LTTVTPPTTEPLTAAEAKTHLRVDHTEEDAWITRAIKAAREFSEEHCGTRWLTQTVKLTLAGWPYEREPGTGLYAIRIPVEPVPTIVAVRYYDAAGVQRTLDTSAYQTWLDRSPPMVAPAPLACWPVLQCGRLAPVEVEFTAGVASAA